MPNDPTKKVGNEAQSKVDEGADKAHSKVDEVAGKAKQVVGQVQEKAGEMTQNLREGAAKNYRQVEGHIARNPTPSILLGFGVGLGFGLVLASLLSSKEETWAEKYLPESLQDVPDRYKTLVDSLKGLPKTVKQNLPSGIAKHLS